MNFSFGDWIVEALKVIETSTHLRRIAYVLAGAAAIHALAALISAL